MTTKTIKNQSTPKFIGLQVNVCPNCEALLLRNSHPFDNKIPIYLIYPFGILAIGLFTMQKWLVYFAVLLFIASIVLIIKKITSQQSTSTGTWREYHEKIPNQSD